MPRYELSLITRFMNKEGFAAVLRQTAKSIMDKGGVVRKIENLGAQELPYRMKAHTEWHTQGRYFLMDFDLGQDELNQLHKELRSDPDLIRPRVVKVQSRYDSQKYKHSYLNCWNSYKKA